MNLEEFIAYLQKRAEEFDMIGRRDVFEILDTAGERKIREI